jgi:hypothetical protein
VSIIYLLLPIFLFSFYSCSHSSDISEKKQVTDSAESANKTPSASSHSDQEAGQEPKEEYTTNNSRGQSSANHPPTAEKATLQLETVNNQDVVKVIASGSDKDGDSVTLNYEWLKNDQPAGTGDAISGFKRGDNVSVTIRPFDGKEYGLSKTLAIQINNSAPTITEYKQIKFDGSTFTDQIKAADPDGDPLTYSLKSAPSGMSIDPSRGLIKWTVPPDYKGNAAFTVSVTDGHGGEALQTLSIEIKPGQQK